MIYRKKLIIGLLIMIYFMSLSLNFLPTSAELLSEKKIQNTCINSVITEKNIVITNNNFDNSKNIHFKYTKNTVGHASININNNSDFASQSASEGWLGNGTEINPYIISGYDIIDITDPLITISNVDVFFEIRECTLIAEQTNLCGIRFNYVANGLVCNNTIANFDQGLAIDIWNSENNTMRDNLVYGNNYGLSLYKSVNNVIANNTIHNNSKTGIDIRIDSNNNTIDNNTISSHKYYGIYVYKSSNNIIIKNCLENNSLHVYGLNIQSYVQHEVKDNTVNGHPLIYWQHKVSDIVPLDTGQIILVNCSDITVTGQEISHCTYGLIAAYCNQLNLSYNSFSFNKGGIALRNSDYSTLSYNTFFNNTNGLNMENTTNTVISHNQISHTQTGIWDSYATNNTFIENTIKHTTDAGIYARYSISNYYEANAITHNQLRGLEFYATANVSLFNNNVSYNTAEGIYLFNGSNVLINKNLVIYNRFGIECRDSVKINISNNFIGYNLVYGSSLYQTSLSCVCHNNYVKNYLYGAFSQVYDDNTESSNTYSHNYWSDFASPDKNEDGIVDNSYYIQGNPNAMDKYPKATYYHLFHVIDKPIVISPNVNKTFNGIVTVLWEASLDYMGHAITYSVFYSSNAGKEWTTLATGLTNNSYEWDTTDFVRSSSYMIRVKAICSEGEYIMDTSDVLFTIDNDVEYKTSSGFIMTPVIIGLTLYTLLYHNKRKNVL